MTHDLLTLAVHLLLRGALKPHAVRRALRAYTPPQRFRILEIKSLLRWSQDQVARLVRVCKNTIANWEAHGDPVSRTVGSTVQPIPPVTRFADVVRATVATMQRLRFGGEDLIAPILARAGWEVSPRSAGRMRREKRRTPPPPTAPTQPAKRRHPVVARFVNHVWMMDGSVIQTFLGGEIHLAGVFDAFSRVPLALQAFERKPGAAAMARLLKTAGRAFGQASTSSRTWAGSSTTGWSVRPQPGSASASASLPRTTITPLRGWNVSGERSKTPRPFVSRRP